MAEIAWNPQLTYELRSFARNPALSSQFSGTQAALVLQSDTRWESESGLQRILFKPYLRFDSRDTQRQYGDLRELSFQHRWANSDLLVGVSRVSWGVAESRNVVDVINQTDAVEDIDGGEKLGQPMVRWSTRHALGTLEAYWLPYFRAQRFPSALGRLRTHLPVDGSAATFERSGGRTAGDVALRLKSTSDSLDLGLHAFYGTDRLARLRHSPSENTLQPHYVALHQYGLDAQWTSEVLLLRLEAVRGRSAGQMFMGWVAGFEYTFFDIKGSGIDAAIVVEQLRDTRQFGGLPITPLDNDRFLGVRLAGNDDQDTELLVGVIRDNRTGGLQSAIEFQRRIGTSHLLEVELRHFNTRRDPFLRSVDRDDVLLLRLTRFF